MKPRAVNITQFCTGLFLLLSCAKLKLYEKIFNTTFVAVGTYPFL